MVAACFDDERLTPRQRFELLFGERTESPAMANQGILWITLLESFKARLEANRVSKLYFENVSRTLKRFTEARNLWNARLEDVTQHDLAEYIRLRSCASFARGNSDAAALSAATINNEIQILNAVFAYAGPRLPIKGHRDNLGLIEAPPYMRAIDEPDPLPVSVTDAQLAAFVQATRFATSPRRSVCDPERFWLAVLVLDSITALRRGALLSVPRPDRETLVEKRQLPIPANLMKNRRAEVIPLGTRDDVVELLASLPSRVGEPLLPWRTPSGQPLSLSHFNATMKRFQIAAGIPREFALKTKHLRSTAATEILAEQFSTDTARKRLGHKSENVIRKHYQARIVTAADRSASDHLASRVMHLVGARPTIPMAANG